MPVCIETGEYIWRLVLGFVLLWLGVIVFVSGRRGSFRFGSLLKLESHKRMAKVVAWFLWGVALVVIAATVLGWGC